VTERSVVQFGTTPIPYTIHRSGRRRTVSIAVDPDHGVIVTAPKDATVVRLDQVVHRKATWIAERLRRRSSAPPPPSEKEFVSGASFMYLGRQYRLKVQPGDVTRPEVRLLRGWLTVTLPGGRNGPSSVGKALVGWYRQHAAGRLPERVAEWARKVGVPVPQVLVRDQRKRWASCDKSGVLRVNWRIIQAPMRLVDYVVAHELVHLFHPDHTPEFWARLGRAMPDYEVRRERLREVGRGLEW
jgi:hypothetical protein